MEPVLQVALDMMQLKRSIGIAAEAVEGGADWVEVGTPLIKSEGAEAVRTVKKAFPGHSPTMPPSPRRCSAEGSTAPRSWWT